MINAISIRDAFLYDETTGEFKSKNAAYKEKIVGTINRRKHSDYAVLSIKHLGAYRKVYAHRAAWMYVNGDIQDGLVVDHIDGNGLNNRIENLRIVTKAINQRNRKNKISTHDLSGVHYHRGGFSIYFLGKYAAWVKDFFEACCIRKSLESRNGFIIEGVQS